eukprot:CAMPEP_0115347512 /NCGR_PEP_ID=MMETSP0270-20121206/94922_1 /TAXON_ID=71861 /ORGANISM="Scrippsiella trochoidea, Strain CCMP3099" /LENGTH=35 /DNA_ID= /DNA_START= /DNA_END= /DNA_ORIENTATION=
MRSSSTALVLIFRTSSFCCGVGSHVALSSPAAALV